VYLNLKHLYMFRLVPPPIIRSATAFVICHTVTVTCRYRGRVGTLSRYQML